MDLKEIVLLCYYGDDIKNTEGFVDGRTILRWILKKYVSM